VALEAVQQPCCLGAAIPQVAVADPYLLLLGDLLLESDPKQAEAGGTYKFAKLT
jgi:hypothetical protein